MKKLPDQYADIADVIERIDNFVEHGTFPGDFVKAVLTNDLKDAFGRADCHNSENMSLIVQYCCNYIPDICWGSPEKFWEWISFKTANRAIDMVLKQTGLPCQKVS